MRLKDYIWACDPVGSTLFVCSATLMLLALDWVGGAYYWSDPHVAVPLALGLALLFAFAGYGKLLLRPLTLWKTGAKSTNRVERAD
jgi:hypothetical protein